jgi:hypothetical protein
MAIVCAEEPKIPVVIDFLNGHWPGGERLTSLNVCTEKAGFRFTNQFPDFFSCFFAKQIFVIVFGLIFIDAIHRFFYLGI